MVEIRQTPMGGDIKELPRRRRVPSTTRTLATIRPLKQDVGDRLNPKKTLLRAREGDDLHRAQRNGKCVGRVTAQIDREHVERYKDGCGFFGSSTRSTTKR